MLYDVELSKDNMNDCSEYQQTEQNKIIKSSQTEQEYMENSIISCTQNLVEFVASYKNKEVTVHLEFPEQQDEEAVSDFFGRLKEIYLGKIKSQSMQRESTALQCTTTREKKEDTNG